MTENFVRTYLRTITRITINLVWQNFGHFVTFGRNGSLNDAIGIVYPHKNFFKNIFGGKPNHDIKKI